MDDDNVLYIIEILKTMTRMGFNKARLTTLDTSTFIFRSYHVIDQEKLYPILELEIKNKGKPNKS